MYHCETESIFKTSREKELVVKYRQIDGFQNLIKEF